MQEDRLGSLIRSVRLRRGLRQVDLAKLAGVAQTTVSLVERGQTAQMSIATLRRIAAPLEIRVDLIGRWRGGDADRLLSRRHSLLAEAVASFIRSIPGWTVMPEVSFSIYGERGVIDLLVWNAATGHLLVIELKTAFVDVNELLGTFDRKLRLARIVARERGLEPVAVSAWLIVSDTTTNRRHARQHGCLLNARFQLDGRSLLAYLRRPSSPTSGLAFWPDSNRNALGRDGAAASHGPKAAAPPNRVPKPRHLVS
jgi:transcriptional regulator with XRE-family HTH domain